MAVVHTRQFCFAGVGDVHGDGVNRLLIETTSSMVKWAPRSEKAYAFFGYRSLKLDFFSIDIYQQTYLKTNFWSIQFSPLFPLGWGQAP